jgi:Protein of unknown function (DUF1552)
MFITKKHLPRRTFLRGAMGTMVSLPLLSAMVPAFAQSGTRRPFRFGAVYMPHGAYPSFWHPEQVGSDFEFNTIMKPLEGFRDQLVTVSRMKAPEGSVHLNASAAWLNGTGPLGETGNYGHIESRTSLDQHIADVVAGDTPLRSLEVGTEDMGTAAGACDGFPCVFFNTLAWRDSTSPLPVGINPQVTFERMFGDPGTAAQRLERLRQKQSVLDSVSRETKRLQHDLGAEDRAILDEYLTNVWRVEQQLQNMEARSDSLANAPAAPVGIPDDFDEHLTLTYDLMHLAFQGDITRVFTFMLGHEGTGRSYAHIGIPEPHHPVSHHGDNPENIEKYSRIPTYQLVKLAEFLGKLEGTADGDGSLLDHSLIYWGSGMGNANVHDRRNPPAVLIGGAHGKLKGNRHVAANDDEPTANLLVALGQMAGAEIESIGESTGRLDI